MVHETHRVMARPCWQLGVQGGRMLQIFIRTTARLHYETVENKTKQGAQKPLNHFNELRGHQRGTVPGVNVAVQCMLSPTSAFKAGTCTTDHTSWPGRSRPSAIYHTYQQMCLQNVHWPIDTCAHPQTGASCLPLHLQLTNCLTSPCMASLQLVTMVSPVLQAQVEVLAKPLSKQFRHMTARAPCTMNRCGYAIMISAAQRC